MRREIYFLLAALTLSAPAHAQTAAQPVRFGIVGIVNGVDNVRVNAVLATPPEPELPCPVTFQFLDSEGKGFNDPEEKVLRGGAAQSLSFIGDPSIRNGTRLPVRATVAIGNPDEFPACRSGVLLTLEVFDRLTRQTRLLVYPPDPCFPREPCQAPRGPE